MNRSGGSAPGRTPLTTRRRAGACARRRRLPANREIVEPNDWAPGSLGVILLEPDLRTEGDTGTLPGHLSYYGPDGFGSCERLDHAAGCRTFIEYINPAVAAIWPV